MVGLNPFPSVDRFEKCDPGGYFPDIDGDQVYSVIDLLNLPPFLGTASTTRKDIQSIISDSQEPKNTLEEEATSSKMNDTSAVLTFINRVSSMNFFPETFEQYDQAVLREKYTILQKSLEKSLKYWNEFLFPEKRSALIDHGIKEVEEKVIPLIKAVDKFCKKIEKKIPWRIAVQYLNEVKQIALDFVSKARGLNGKSHYGIFYCAYLKNVLTYLDYHQYLPEESALVEATEEFEKSLFGFKKESYENGIKAECSYRDEEADEDGWKKTVLRINDTLVRFNTASRAKSEYRIIRKAQEESHYSLPHAVKDQIGLRIELQENDFKLVFPAIFEQLKSISHNNFRLRLREKKSTGDTTSPHPIMEYMMAHKDGELQSYFPVENKWLTFYFCPLEIEQNGHFEDFRVNCNWTATNQKRHKVEIQFIPVGHQNEIGVSDHAVFENVQKVETIIRTFGFITRHDLTLLIRESIEAALSNPNLDSYLEQEYKRTEEEDKNVDEYKRRKKKEIETHIVERFMQDLVLMDKKTYSSVSHLERLEKLYGESLGRRFRKALDDHRGKGSSIVQE